MHEEVKMHDEVKPSAPEAAPAGPGFDLSEPRARFIGVFGVALVVLLVAIILGLQWYFDRVHEQQIFVKQLEPVSEDLKALRAREDTDLYGYRYIDRQKGIVRIPIDRAMQLVVKERSGAN